MYQPAQTVALVLVPEIVRVLHHGVEQHVLFVSTALPDPTEESEVTLSMNEC